MKKLFFSLILTLLSCQSLAWDSSVQQQGDCINEIVNDIGFFNQTVKLHKLHNLEWVDGSLTVTDSIFPVSYTHLTLPTTPYV